MNNYNEQVYDCYYDTAGNYHWTGVYSGEHIERGGRVTKEEAIKRIKDHKIIHRMSEPRAVHISEALDMAIRSLEAQETVHGEWIESIEEEITMHEYVNDLPPGKYKKYTCSECKYKTGNLAKEYDFCPKCGADMRRETNE